MSANPDLTRREFDLRSIAASRRACAGSVIMIRNWTVALFRSWWVHRTLSFEADFVHSRPSYLISRQRDSQRPRVELAADTRASSGSTMQLKFVRHRSDITVIPKKLPRSQTLRLSGQESDMLQRETCSYAYHESVVDRQACPSQWSRPMSERRGSLWRRARTSVPLVE